MSRFRRVWMGTVASILGIALIASVQVAPASARKTPSCKEAAESLLSRMTLDEKAGQMVMAVTGDAPDGMPDEKTRKVLQDYHVGSVIIYNKPDPAFMAEYNNRLQKWASQTRLGIPLLISADLEFGAFQNIRRGTTAFPRQMGIGATHSIKDAAEAARLTAREARAMGFHWNFAPVADVNTNPENPVIGVRSFGENPQLAAKLTAAQVRAYQKEKVMASAKHFPGHGDTDVDSHLGLPRVGYDRKTLETVHLLPFRAAIDAGVDSIMTAHVVVEAIDPELPATLSHKVLTGLLRNEMGYDGIIITDAMTMDAIDENWGTREAAAMAVQAGADVIMSTGSFEDHVETVSAIRDGVRTGAISEKRVNDSVRRVLRAKCEYGLFTDRYADPKRAERVSGHTSHRKKADHIARRATTLVKNEGVLPFRRNGQTTLVAGVIQVPEAVEAVKSVGGGQVIGWQARTHDPTAEEIQEAVRLAEQADRILVATYSQSKLPPGQSELVRALLKTGKPVAALSLGLPYDLADYPEVDAYLASYALDRWQTPNPTALRAAVEVIFGKQPGGRLPVTIGDLYPCGHGLRYD